MIRILLHIRQGHSDLDLNLVYASSDSWSDIDDDLNPSEQVDVFENQTRRNLDKYLPQKSIKINPNVDKPSEMKRLDRQVKREYRKHGKSEHYKKLQFIIQKLRYSVPG